MKQQKISTHLWFDKDAKESAQLYVSTFSNSSIKSINQFLCTPSGTIDIVTLDISGIEFTFLNGGPMFQVNPSISFLVSCKTKEEVLYYYEKLSKNGVALMELGEYPFSEQYAWIQDKYGVSWQLYYSSTHEPVQTIVPTLMFVGSVCGKAEEAIRFYTSVFHHSKEGGVLRYGKEEAPDKEGTIKHAEFTLENLLFGAMDSAHSHAFSFNEAVSFIVHCATQEEIDYYWDKLSAVPEAEQCGWLKDQFGVSWQIVPTHMNEVLMLHDEKKAARVTEAFLQMKKFDLEALKRVAED